MTKLGSTLDGVCTLGTRENVRFNVARYLTAAFGRRLVYTLLIAEGMVWDAELHHFT